jgi:hypothetical protein
VEVLSLNQALDSLKGAFSMALAAAWVLGAAHLVRSFLHAACYYKKTPQEVRPLQ